MMEENYRMIRGETVRETNNVPNYHIQYFAAGHFTENHSFVKADNVEQNRIQ